MAWDPLESLEITSENISKSEDYDLIAIADIADCSVPGDLGEKWSISDYENTDILDEISA